MGHSGGCWTSPACVRDAVLEDPSGAQNHSGRVEITEDSGPMLWSNSPETVTDAVAIQTPVLAKMTLAGAGRFAVGCHHANGRAVNTKLTVVIYNPPGSSAIANVLTLRNAQGYHCYTGSYGHEVALPGRDAATGWFLGAGAGGNSAIFPGMYASTALGHPLFGLEGGALEINGIASAAMEFQTDSPVTVFVVAGDGPLDWGTLNDPTNWAPRDSHHRGTVNTYRMRTEYDDPPAAPVPIRIPNEDGLRRRYEFLDPDEETGKWRDITDEMNPSPIPEAFTGEYHIEQTIRLFAINETPDLSSVGVVLNGRGGPYAGGYWASNAGTIAIAPLCELLPPNDPVNLGVLLEQKDGLRVPKFSVPPGGPHPFEFKFMTGGGSALPLHFVAFPCTPFVGELEDPPQP